MNVFTDFPLISLFVVTLAALLIARLAWKAGSGSRAQRECPNCGLSLPTAAEYCRRCGKKLS
jgi:predicted amidophosphoribosyltransferase